MGDIQPKNHDSIKVDDIKEKTTSHGIEIHNTVKIDTIAEKTSAAGVTVDGILLKDGGAVATGNLDTSSSVTTDTITEHTSAAGVTVEGVLLKDSEINSNTINESTSDTGVTVDGLLIKDSEIYTDVINEASSAVGVTADGVLLKDSNVTATDISAANVTTTTALKTNTISERTAASGVTIDGVVCKDGSIDQYNSDVQHDTDAAFNTSSTSYQTVMTLSVTTLANDKVLLIATGVIEDMDAAAHFVSIFRSTTQLTESYGFDATNPSSSGRHFFAIHTVDDSVTAGTHSYHFKVTSGDGSLVQFEDIQFSAIPIRVA